MDESAIGLIALGFGLFLAMFLKIEAASLRYYFNFFVLASLMFGVVALAGGESHLVLASGTYFTLDRPELEALAYVLGDRQLANLLSASPGGWQDLSEHELEHAGLQP